MHGIEEVSPEEEVSRRQGASVWQGQDGEGQGKAMLIFPRDVFKAKGSKFASLLCTSQEAYDKALANGWFATVHEALKPAPVADPEPIAEDVRPSRAELESEAKRLGVKLDSRNSDERLAERIMDAHAALPSED